MSDKALLIAKEEILKVIKTHSIEITNEEAVSLADKLIKIIDWDNPALMHKSITWITKHYLQNCVCA